MSDKQQYESETPEREAYIAGIGMIYEYYDKAGPRGINGKPIFSSCQLMSKGDADKFVEIYKEYCKAREEFEKNF